MVPADRDGTVAVEWRLCDSGAGADTSPVVSGCDTQDIDRVSMALGRNMVPCEPRRCHLRYLSIRAHGRSIPGSAERTPLSETSLDCAPHVLTLAKMAT